MEAIPQGFLKIGSGVADVMLVGGTESMSNLPLIYRPEMVDIFAELMRAKTLGKRLSAFAENSPRFLLNPIIAIQEGLTDPFCGIEYGANCGFAFSGAGNHSGRSG